MAAIRWWRKSSHSKCPSRASASATPNAVRSHGCENLRAPSARGGRSGEPIMLVTAKCSNRDCMAAVPGLDFDRRRNIESELLENDARLARRPRPERRVFVPIGRETEHWPRIARAQGADDEVVHRRRVRDGA